MTTGKMAMLVFLLSILLTRLDCTSPFLIDGIKHTPVGLSGNKKQKAVINPISSLSSSSRKHSSMPLSTSTVSQGSAIQTTSRQDGQHVMDNVLLPQSNYGDRIACGGDAQGLWESPSDEPGKSSSRGLVDANDPSTQLTYGEFPLQSFDELLDLALKRVQPSTLDDRIELLDVGSGCGRLVLYAGLTRGKTGEDLPPWTIHGIEISNLLHGVAAQALQKGLDLDLFSSSMTDDDTIIRLHQGAVEEHGEVLSRSHVLFAYSTVFASSGFSPELGAMVLGDQWSQTLSKSCRNGCVAITTDRALDPAHGWELVDRLDVENREVMGSKGYIHVLRK